MGVLTAQFRLFLSCNTDIKKRRFQLPIMRFHAIAALYGAASALSTASAQRLCNGHAELCDRRYSNVTFVGSHNTAFVGFMLADNQAISVEHQLAMGVRLFETQTHRLWRRSDDGLFINGVPYDEPDEDDEDGGGYEEDEEWSGGTDPIGHPDGDAEDFTVTVHRDVMIRLCHTRCSIRNAGRLKHFLETIKKFLDANTREVVTLVLTNNNGMDCPPPIGVFLTRLYHTSSSSHMDENPRKKHFGYALECVL